MENADWAGLFPVDGMVMARFRKFRTPKINTVIGRDTKIAGDLKFVGGLHVDGVIKGNVYSDNDARSTLILSDSGSIEGDVRVANVILNGTVIGDVYAGDRAELAPHAKISGTVYYSLLEMAMGAEVNGQLIHSENGPPPLLGFDDTGESDNDREQTAGPASPEAKTHGENDPAAGSNQ